MNSITKKCSTCGKEKPVADFYLNKSRGKLYARCKKCHNALSRDWADKNPQKLREYQQKHYYKDIGKTHEKIREYARKWRAKNPERTKEINKKSRSKNAERYADLYRKWRAENGEKIRAYLKEWNKRNKEKTREYSRNRYALETADKETVTHEEWEQVMNQYGNRCLWCGRGDVSLTIDHVVPLSKGGRHHKSNIQPLCKSCNSRKNNQVMDFRNGNF